MRGLLICCLVALATCQSLRYDISLNPKKRYEYRYEGMVNFGLGMPDLAESGVKITCKAKITGVSEKNFLLQVSDLAFSEYHGFPGKDGYEASPKLSKRIAAQLIKPLMFEYNNGHVGDILASAEISTTVVNIVRGILGFFQVTVKTTQRIYELEEIGIHGKCQSNYAIEENMETKDLNITQVVDVTNCREKAAMYRGMAAAVVDKISKERGESTVSTVRYVYTVKPTAEGGLITKAHGLEQQHFTPFNVKGGTFKMQATKEMKLLAVSDMAGVVPYGTLESKGNIVYKFADVDNNFPIMIQSLEDPIPKAIELIKRLAEANIYHIDSKTTEDSMKVYQLMRVIPYEGLDTMWKQFSGHPEYRRWFLDMTVEIGDAKVLKFLENRFKAGDLTPTEAWHTFLMAMEHLKEDLELVEMAKGFLGMPFSKSAIYLWHTVVLSYGSLVYKHCAYHTPCPVTVVQPLLEMAMEALKSGNKDDMVLVLKALGNAGHPGSIKTIMRFLPVAATPVDLPLRVQSAAVQAMRLIAERDPRSVQDVTMSLLLQKNLPTDIRILAFMILVDTKPSMALVYTVTTHLLVEKDLHVASFAYSYFKSLARSRTPDNHFLSTASSVAVKILAPKFGRLSYHYSKAMRMDWFNDDLLTGAASEIFMLRSAASLFPTEIMTKGDFHFIGRILQLLELGVRADGLKELFSSSNPMFKGNFSFSDFQAIFNVLRNWEILPNDKPVMSAYSRVSGQEWFFTDISKEVIRNILMAISPSAGKATLLWTAIEKLQRGTSWHYTRPFLVLEGRYFQATSLGLPVEISKYYNSITAITVNAKATLNPAPTEHLGQLLTSEISLDTDGFAGVTKDYLVFYGISTELFKSGCEMKSKVPVAVPWKFSAKINVAEKRFEMDFPPCKEEIQLVSVRFNVFAVSRNIEEPDSVKKTPIMPTALDSNDKGFLKNASVVRPESQQIRTPDTWHPNSKMCVKSNIYGAGLCMDYGLTRQYFNELYPLYYLIGDTHMALKIVPVKTNKVVDKIHFEVNASPSKQPVNARQVLEMLRTLSKEAAQQENLSSESASSVRGSHHSHSGIFMDFNSTPEPAFIFKAFAMSGNQKPEGYNAAMYYTPTANIQNSQLIVSQVGENTNWKMCVDTSMDVHAVTEARVKWGAECQTYEMSMSAAAFQLPDSDKLMLKAKVHLKNIPENMTEFGTRIERYIPGVALVLGFHQENEKNAEQEVSASVVVASADSVDVTVKFPQYTVHREAMSLPVTFAGFQEFQQSITNATMDGFGQA